MAIVRMSKALRERMLAEVKKGYDQRIKDSWAKFSTQTFGDQFYEDHISEDLRQRLMAIPSGWLDESTEAYIKLAKQDVQLTFSCKRPIPKVWGTRWYAPEVTLIQGTKSWEMSAEYMEDIRLAAEERREVEEKVGPLINEAPSLQYLVKIWPSALDFVDEETKKRYHTPATPRGHSAKGPHPIMTEEAMVAIAKVRLNQA